MAKRKRPGRKHPSGNQWIKKLLALLAAALAGFIVYILYHFFGSNTAAFGDKKFFYVRTGSTYKDVVKGLQEQGIVRNIKSFEWLARKVDYPSHVRAGKYEIKAGMSSFAIVRLLRAGRQTPVKLVINKLRTKQDFIRLVSNNLEADSISLQTLLSDPIYLRQFGLDTNTALCAVIPDTYQFYWNTSAEKTFERLVRERKKFWNEQRRRKAAQLGLTPNEVMILASIIEEETNKNDEKSLIASVYLNRLKKGMKLSADPTVKFALQDFGLKRIHEKQILFPSPYNTYLNKGLPPGPICTPTIKTIDAVLNVKQTDYLYFCAKDDFSGYHVFAATYAEHLKNARKYQLALDQMGIQ